MDIKTLGNGQAYKSNQIEKPVEVRQEKVHKDYMKNAKIIDRDFNNTPMESKGPLTQELETYGKTGKVIGLVIGAFSECSTYVHQLARLAGKYEAMEQVNRINPNIIKKEQIIGNVHQKHQS